jgi:hypothetical protein
MNRSAFAFFPFFVAGTLSVNASIPLAEASRQNKVSLVIGTYQPADNRYHSGYFSECMKYVVKNLTPFDLDLTEAAGRFLMPGDTDLQRMVVTSALHFTLKAGEERTIPLYAMCTEASDGSPVGAAGFRYGSVATGKLSQLVAFIDQKNYQNEAAQAAVWAVTDNYSPYSIYDHDTSVMNSLRRYVCKLKNIPYDPAGERIMNETPLMRYITGTFTFSIYKEQNVDLVVFTNDHKLVKEVLKDQVYPAGQHTVTYEVSIPVGDPSGPPTLLLMFYLDGKLIANRKHVLTAFR